VSDKEFEDHYLDVLQNIEYGIVQACRADPAILDAHVASALDGLIRLYQAETRGRSAPHLALSPLAQAVFDSAKTMCDWRLGRERLVDEQGIEPGLAMTPKTLDEIVACLKRVRRSVDVWTKKGGRQGYVNYVSQFIK
jgi:hypothetical protein